MASVERHVVHGKTGGEETRQDNGLDMKTLFVRSIPADVSDEELSEFFSNFAPIKHAVVVKDAQKKSRGFGFVSFAVEEDTLEALKQARKTKLRNNLLRIDIAKRRDRSKKRDEVAPAGAVEETKSKNDLADEESLLRGKPKIIIRNMPWSCRDADKLKKIFGKFGTVVEAKIPKKSDGRLCGFAFVTMKKLANCRAAIEGSRDLKIDGRSVAVDFAVQKSKWEEYNKTKEDQAEAGHAHSQSEEEDQVENDEEEGQESGDDSEIESEHSDEELEGDQGEQERLVASNKNRRENFSVFVRNVPYDATEESLAEHFSKFGPVKYALPVIDKQTGLAKGTAFVAFKSENAYNDCLRNAPAAGATSLLIGDDVQPQYVYEGRVLSISPTLKREDASQMAEKNAAKRKEILGKAPGERDKRNLYLLNEGKVIEGSKLASLLSPKDMEIREASYKLRVDQLKKNPSLHLSLTRLAIRNLPRAMTDKSLKALARKAIVEFSTQVKNGERHPLSKEELIRSTKEKYKFMSPEEIEREKKKDKKHGVVKQAKVIMEVKGANVGRSRGYGFVEYKDHKHALMGLRWLNVHQVTMEEVQNGDTEEAKTAVDSDSFKSRRLCVEFAIENANVVKRRRENVKQARESAKRRHEEAEDKGNNFKKAKIDSAASKTSDKATKSGLSDDAKRLIGLKRKRKSLKK
ncbi:hypothetical protein HG536_0H01500 [Torulaspora globosa]|uniref:RRM domain-containing protein n=1 Tax=Torulaspora globosa TaxID=48254 RepID=A0A7G3ZMN9_9SACH|nr:uncharacterized protein HG536_0H01500 [Torulaspora globosa]QLL34775.1 hypothetical protein HG536_0H01500 [Torulaspora globosa]